jgi:hypothetical protein
MPYIDNHVEACDGQNCAAYGCADLPENRWTPPATVDFMGTTYNVCQECSYIVERCHCIRDEEA